MTRETEITDWLASQRETMVAMIREMVNTDSGSYNKPGIDAVGAIVQRFMAQHGITVETVAQQKHGDCLRALGKRTQSQSNQGNIVLMGHRDTVFPDGEAGRRPFTIQNGRAYGPGVADMKAGLVMNAFILAAFEKFGAAPGPMVALFTGDEEIGSPEGRAVIEAEARMARVVFNSEPGRISGNVVKARKGGVFSAFSIEGKASHSGGNFAEGISAIGELAHKVIALHALTDLDAGITLNVGLISGGQSVNTVAPLAEGQIDLRYVTAPQRAAVMARIEAIIGHATIQGTRATLEIRGEFLPMEQSPEAARLLALYQGAAADCGFHPEGEFTGGCADSGFTAALGTPTLCGVGPVGGKAHSPEEFLDLESIVPRAQALARAICRLDQAGV
jgi:glutamate carboxypeptidase